MNAIENQIKEMYEKAFFDIIDETIHSDKPDYDWIVRLYEEIKERLIKYIKKDSKIYKQLDEEFDTVLFKQMITNDAFDLDSLLKLINNTFLWVGRLQAPIRDKETEEAKKRVLNAEPNKMVSTFIKEVNLCINNIDEDIYNYIALQKSKE